MQASECFSTVDTKKHPHREKSPCGHCRFQLRFFLIGLFRLLVSFCTGCSRPLGSQLIVALAGLLDQCLTERNCKINHEQNRLDAEDRNNCLLDTALHRRCDSRGCRNEDVVGIGESNIAVVVIGSPVDQINQIVDLGFQLCKILLDALRLCRTGSAGLFQRSKALLVVFDSDLSRSASPAHQFCG